MRRTRITFITRPDFAAMILRAPKTLETWARAGYGPRPVKLGVRRVAYRLTEVDRWLRENARRARQSARRPMRSQAHGGAAQ